MIKKIKLLIDKASKCFRLNHEEDELNVQILRKQILRGVIALLLIFCAIFLAFYTSSSATKSKFMVGKNKTDDKTVKLEVASEALDPELMWRNHFEDKLDESKEVMQAELKKIRDSFMENTEESKSEAKTELNTALIELEIAKNELKEAIKEIKNLKNTEENDLDQAEARSSLNVTQIIEDEEVFNSVKDSKLYIPATSYVSGALLGGIAVSTSVNSSSEPVPLVIRVTDRGNLPKNFKANLKNCRILASSYGDISSERAVIRAESLVCVDPDTEEVLTTRVSGIIYGDDGMNGIKGRVVSTSNKHIKHAATAAMLSSLAGGLKSEGSFAITSFGAINTKKRGLEDRIKDNGLLGIGNAAEKIASYYLKEAENMSPVLLIPGGSRVDVVFTKGVFLGSADVVNKIEENRMRNKKNTENE